MVNMADVMLLIKYSISKCLQWLETFFLATGATPYFIAMFFVLCVVWFLLDPIFERGGGSDRAQRRIDSNANDTKRLGSGR